MLQLQQRARPAGAMLRSQPVLALVRRGTILAASRCSHIQIRAHASAVQTGSQHWRAALGAATAAARPLLLQQRQQGQQLPFTTRASSAEASVATQTGECSIWCSYSLVAHDSCRACLQQQLGVARGAIRVVRTCTHMCVASRHSSKALTQCVGLPVHARMLTTGCALRLVCKLYITRAIFCTARPTCTHYTLHLGQ